jgi:hypothetical protein
MHPDLKAITCADLLSRLELLDELIREQGTRTQWVQDRGWDSAAFVKRSQLLRETRRCQVQLLRLLLDDEDVDDPTSASWQDHPGRGGPDQPGGSAGDGGNSKPRDR